MHSRRRMPGKSNSSIAAAGRPGPPRASRPRLCLGPKPFDLTRSDRAAIANRGPIAREPRLPGHWTEQRRPCDFRWSGKKDGRDNFSGSTLDHQGSSSPALRRAFLRPIGSCLRPDRSLIASADSLGNIDVWDTKTGRLRVRLSGKGRVGLQRGLRCDGESGRVRNPALRPGPLELQQLRVAQSVLRSPQAYPLERRARSAQGAVAPGRRSRAAVQPRSAGGDVRLQVQASGPGREYVLALAEGHASLFRIPRNKADGH